MSTIQLTDCKSVSVYSNRPMKNFSYERCNLIERWIEHYNRQISEAQTLIKYDIDSLEGATIQKAMINLGVEAWRDCEWRDYYLIKIAINQTDFNPAAVTWRTKPLTSYYKTVKVGRQELASGSISLDITSLLQDWVEGTTPNYGITLSSEVVGLSIRLLSCESNCGPKLTVHYEKDMTQSVALQVQVANRKQEMIENKETILFDNIVASTPHGITYNPITGDITISKAGYYLGEWWVSIGGAAAVPELNVSLQNVGTGSLIEASAPVVVESQMSGNAIFHVANEPQTFRLINNSKNTIQYAASTIQASLIIAKI